MARVIVTVSPSYTVIPYFQDVITIDKGNNRVGVNNTSPEHTLDLFGSGTAVKVTSATYSSPMVTLLNASPLPNNQQWERSHLSFNRKAAARDLEWTTAENALDEFVVASMSTGEYNDFGPNDGGYTFWMVNQSRGVSSGKQQLVLFNRGEVGVGWPNSSSDNVNGDAQLTIRTDYCVKDTALKIRCAINDSFVAAEDQVLTKAIHVVSSEFVNTSPSPPPDWPEGEIPPMTSEIVNPQDIFTVRADNGLVHVNNDLQVDGGVILKSPNGTQWSLSVSDAGVLSVSEITP